MPIYEYRCAECAQIFEEWQKDYSEHPASCPVCGAKAERVISHSSFVLKGGGWYSDLYSKPSAGECKPGSCSCKSDSAPAKKADAKPACTSGGCAN